VPQLSSIPANLATAYAAAHAICRLHARSFHFASHFLPHDKRLQAFAVYAFCRLLDDAADLEPSLASVARFESLLDLIYQNEIVRTPDADELIALGITDPDQRLALTAFADTARRARIPVQLFRDLAIGCRMDFEPVRYNTWHDLERYCYHVAGVVGLMMCRVFDVTDPDALDRAVVMGHAMQLTNILRDVREDRDRGRIYLPLEDLWRFNIDPEDLMQDRRTASFDAAMKQLVRFEIERARSLYNQAADALCQIHDTGSRRTACVMAVVYGGILRAIERQDHDVFVRRARLTTMQKLFRIPAALRLARRRSDQPLPVVF
jgi:phytoene synthase